MKATQDSTNLSLAPDEATLGRRTVIQRSALAGFRHHAALRVWPALRDNDLLSLVREADNPHDADAVAIYWKSRKLGYLPRGENFLVARLLDRERTLSARVRRLLPNAAHNQRVRMDVLLH
jgi:hypothetical protein